MKKLLDSLIAADRWGHRHAVLLFACLALFGFMIFFQLLLPAQQTSANYDPDFCATYVTDIPQEECEKLAAFYLSTDGDNWHNNANWFVTTGVCDSWYGISCQHTSQGACIDQMRDPSINCYDQCMWDEWVCEGENVCIEYDTEEPYDCIQRERNPDGGVCDRECGTMTTMCDGGNVCMEYEQTDPFVSSIYLPNNNLNGAVDLSGFLQIYELSLDGNNITSIFVSDMPSLGIINASYNSIENVSLSGIPNIYHLELDNNDIAAIDVTNLNLNTLFLQNNLLTSLDISLNPASYRDINISNNYIHTLNIDTYQNYHQNSYMQCTQEERDPQGGSCYQQCISETEVCDDVYVCYEYDEEDNCIDGAWEMDPGSCYRDCTGGYEDVCDGEYVCIQEEEVIETVQVQSINNCLSPVDQNIIDFLDTYDISSRSVDQDNCEVPEQAPVGLDPQHQWCYDQDSLGFLQIPLEECYILADFYVATEGDNWYSTQNNNAPWFQGNGWVSICRGGRHGINNCAYDGNTGRYSIQDIGFPWEQGGNNLSGYIPNSLYTLPMLNSIHITRNPNLIVNIDDITQSPYAANLISINVHNSSIYGNINNFVNTPNLQYLDVACYTDADYDNCNLVGDTSFVSSLPALYGLRIGGHSDVTLDLSDLENNPGLQQIYALNNYILGDLSSLTGATGMQSLDLGCRGIFEGQCNVTGNLDALQNMANLQYLSLDQLVNIQGTLDVLYDKIQLEQIDLTHNKISGTIQAAIANLTRLEHLDLNNNDIEGTLPQELLNLYSLRELEINDNDLTGSLIYFGSMPSLESLSLGADNLDYSNFWDMITPSPNLCLAAPSGPCEPISRLKKLRVQNADIGQALPDVFDAYTNLEELQLQFTKITGPLPPSFASLTNLIELQLRFNNLDGEIPAYLASFPLEEIAIESNCFDTDVSDPSLLALLETNGGTWVNQFNCKANVQITAQSSGSSLQAGQCQPYTIHYNNFGPQKAINLIIGQAFGENIVVSGSTPSFEEGLVGRVYGTMDDPCYVDAVQSATGPYVSRYEDLLTQDEDYPFASVYDLAIVLGQYLGGEQFTGAQGTTEFDYALDRFCPFVFGIEDHYLCLLLFGMDLKQINDPSCGYGGEPGYVWELGTVPANTGGDIHLTLCNQSEQIELLSCSDINVDTISENENLATCDISVQSGVCGDGVLDEGEQCDDSNTEDGDGCSAVCEDELPEEPQPYCGDGVVDLPGEQCDNGPGNGVQPTIPQPVYGQSGSVAYCSNACTTQTISYNGGYCGDDIVNGPEQCDGSQNCTSSCTLIQTDPDPEPTPYCGDGETNAGEQCDGGLLCNPNCTLKSLGYRGGQPILTPDLCPDGDFSVSYYDNDCGEVPVIAEHGAADDQKVWDNLIDDPIAFTKKVADVTKNMQCNIRNELVQAYVFAFDLQVTTVTNICNANLQTQVTREELAKFLSTYAMTVLGKKPDTTRACVFGDMANSTAEMQTFARISCELEIMGLTRTGAPDKMFRPKDFVPRTEIFTALNRMINGTIDNSATGLWYGNHMKRLLQQKVIFDTTDPERNALRGEILLMLMRGYSIIKNR